MVQRSPLSLSPYWCKMCGLDGEGVDFIIINTIFCFVCMPISIFSLFKVLQEDHFVLNDFMCSIYFAREWCGAGKMWVMSVFWVFG